MGTSASQRTLLLGVDIGTGSSKGVLTRADGEVIAVSERPHDLSLPAPGWAEHDAETVWWRDFVEICAELLAQVGDGELAGLAVSGIGPCIVACDEDATPLRPAILYGIDTRSGAEVEELTDLLGEADIVARCGNPMNAQSVGGRLLWLRRNEPEVYARTAHWFMASSFIAHRLTGAYFLDHISAGFCEPLYDVHEGRWIPEWCEEVAPGIAMPELRWPGEIAGRVSAEGARLTGLPEGLPVAAGTMDAFADAMSVGARNPGDGVMIYGSTMSIVVVTDRPYSSPQLWSNAHLFEGTYHFTSGTATSGSLTKWLRDLIGDVSFAELTAEAAAVEPGSHGLVVLPYFAGERTPILDPQARGTICGLTLSHGRGHLYRALLEATAYAARHILDAMAAAGTTPTRLFSVGGGTTGGLWPQIVSDVTGLAQDITQQSMGACYGDAMLAGVASGTVERDAEWTSVVRRVEPDPEAGRVYDELYAVYRELHPQTVELQHRLAALQTGT